MSDNGGHEELYRDLCENASDLIQSVDPDGRFVYVNRAWLETLEYDLDKVERLNVFDVIHPDSRDHCRRAFETLLEGGDAEAVEAVFVTRTGRRVYVEGRVRCVFEDGKPISTRGIFRDVTKRKHAEDELEQLFQVSLDLLCVAGIDGYFRHLNPAFERVLGYTLEELKNRPFIDFVHPDDVEKTTTEVKNLAGGIPTVDFENRYRARDGSFRWLSWRAASLPGEDLIFAVARDVTEMKEAQQLMAKQAEELARSNADLEQFAYVASHDLSRPLRTIGTLTGWIEESLAAGDTDKAKEHLQELRSRAGLMQQLVSDLLDYARAGRVDDRLGEVDTEAMVRDLVYLLDPPDGLEIEIRPGLPKLRTSRAPLEQVFRNLIGNAIKHHDRERGRIVVSARQVNGKPEFSVSDDGPGIPPRYHERVFGMFQKLSTRPGIEGTGVGLALVQRIVERRGGRIVLESEGRGATFRFTWP